MSGTGNIRDASSDMYDIDISMGRQYHYAVIGPAYYTLTATRHRTLEAAATAENRLVNAGYEGIFIIDRDATEWRESRYAYI